MPVMHPRSRSTLLTPGFWRTLAFLYGCLWLLSLALGALFGSWSGKAWEWVAYLITATGLMGFAYQRRVFRDWFWQFWCVLFLLWNLGFLLPGALGSGPTDLATMDAPPLEALGFYAVALVFGSPVYVGLYLYAFRCQRLWRPRS